MYEIYTQITITVLLGLIFLLTGLVIGCLSVYGLRLSTLEYLYNRTCKKSLVNFANILHGVYELYDSLYIRLTPISSVTIGTSIDELFIETWENTYNYSNYYSICAPLTCRYTYVDRNNTTYMLTTFLGLYGE
ncbi:unnamed protein product [Rotaria sordida]|nr:unnamed protein product [Rotaria sordida]CAF1423039.1 unnamed protein product [Rotaria sordida]